MCATQPFFEQQITIFDSESEDQTSPDAAILTSTLKGTSLFSFCSSGVYHIINKSNITIE